MPCISQGTIHFAMSYRGEASVAVLCTSHFQDSKDDKGSNIFHFQNTPEQCDVFCLQVVLHEPGKRAVFPPWSLNGVSMGGGQSAMLQDQPLGLMGSLLGSYEVVKHLGSRRGAQQFGAGLQTSQSMVECQAVKVKAVKRSGHYGSGTSFAREKQGWLEWCSSVCPLGLFGVGSFSHL